MKKILFASIISLLFIGCSESSSEPCVDCEGSVSKPSSDDYCKDTDLKHGEKAKPNPDEGYEHFCVLVDGKLVDKEPCEKEGPGVGRRYGEGGLYAIYNYNCVKDDDTHLYKTDVIQLACPDGNGYGYINKDKEVCVYIGDALVYKPVCDIEADRENDCLRDDGDLFYHK